MASIKKTVRKKEAKVAEVEESTSVFFYPKRELLEEFIEEDLLKIKRAFNVRITFDGDKFEIQGHDIRNCRKVAIVLENIFAYIRKGIEVTEEDVDEFIQRLLPKALETSQYKAIYTGADGIEYSPRTENQELFVDLALHNTITIAAGCAGTGKTKLAAVIACKLLKENRYDKILIFRPIVAVGSKSLGFLPGSVEEKIGPYADPAASTFIDLLGEKTFEYFTKTKKLEIGSVALCRGQNFNDAVILIDEVQNMSKIEILTLLTRIGFNTKVIITGDQSQTDTRGSEWTGLDYCVNNLKDIESVGIVKMTEVDIQRNGIIREVIKAFEWY